MTNKQTKRRKMNKNEKKKNIKLFGLYIINPIVVVVDYYCLFNELLSEMFL